MFPYMEDSMTEWVPIDTTPFEEDCVNVDPNTEYLPAMREEARKYVKMLNGRFINFNKTKFKINSNRHDFGTYLDISICFIEEDEESIKQAQFIEGNLPARWTDKKVFNYPQCLESNE